MSDREPGFVSHFDRQMPSPDESMRTEKMNRRKFRLEKDFDNKMHQARLEVFGGDDLKLTPGQFLMTLASFLDEDTREYFFSIVKKRDLNGIVAVVKYVADHEPLLRTACETMSRKFLNDSAAMDWTEINRYFFE